MGFFFTLLHQLKFLSSYFSFLFGRLVSMHERNSILILIKFKSQFSGMICQSAHCRSTPGTMAMEQSEQGNAWLQTKIFHEPKKKNSENFTAQPIVIYKSSCTHTHTHTSREKEREKTLDSAVNRYLCTYIFYSLPRTSSDLDNRIVLLHIQNSEEMLSVCVCVRVLFIGKFCVHVYFHHHHHPTIYLSSFAALGAL